MAAWWSGDVADLLASEPEAIVQRLAVRLVETHHLNRDTQLHAWRQQIVLLRTALQLLRARARPGFKQLRRPEKTADVICSEKCGHIPTPLLMPCEHAFPGIFQITGLAIAEDCDGLPLPIGRLLRKR